MRFAYREGRDVLHGVDAGPAPGERLARGRPVRRRQVDAGPAAGRASTRPRTGRVDASATCRWSTLAAGASCASTSCWSPRSTTCSSARVRGQPAAGPAGGQPRASCGPRWRAVDAVGWVVELPDGLDTEVGSGGQPLTPAQAQQLALARLVLADPHTLVLDEATSLLDPRAARHLERSLAAVAGRPHRRGDRAPAAHRARRGPGRGRRGRPDQRARQPRRADRGRRRVRRAVALLAGRAGRTSVARSCRP